MSTIVVLHEQPLHPHDVERIATWSSPPPTVHLVTATVPEGGRFARLVDEIATGGAFPDPARPEAALDASLAALKESGVDADGELAGTDTVAAVVQAVATLDAGEVWVVTPLHWLEDTMHTDWASELRDAMTVPVVHFVSGTDQLID